MIIMIITKSLYIKVIKCNHNHHKIIWKKNMNEIKVKKNDLLESLDDIALFLFKIKENSFVFAEYIEQNSYKMNFQDIKTYIKIKTLTDIQYKIYDLAIHTLLAKNSDTKQFDYINAPTQSEILETALSLEYNENTDSLKNQIDNHTRVMANFSIIFIDMSQLKEILTFNYLEPSIYEKIKLSIMENIKEYLEKSSRTNELNLISLLNEIINQELQKNKVDIIIPQQLFIDNFSKIFNQTPIIAKTGVINIFTFALLKEEKKEKVKEKMIRIEPKILGNLKIEESVKGELTIQKHEFIKFIKVKSYWMPLMGKLGQNFELDNLEWTSNFADLFKEINDCINHFKEFDENWIEKILEFLKSIDISKKPTEFKSLYEYYKTIFELAAMEGSKLPVLHNNNAILDNYLQILSFFIKFDQDMPTFFQKEILYSEGIFHRLENLIKNTDQSLLENLILRKIYTNLVMEYNNGTLDEIGLEEIIELHKKLITDVESKAVLESIKGNFAIQIKIDELNQIETALHELGVDYRYLNLIQKVISLSTELLNLFMKSTFSDIKVLISRISFLQDILYNYRATKKIMGFLKKFRHFDNWNDFNIENQNSPWRFFKDIYNDLLLSYISGAKLELILKELKEMNVELPARLEEGVMNFRSKSLNYLNLVFQFFSGKIEFIIDRDQDIEFLQHNFLEVRDRVILDKENQKIFDIFVEILAKIKEIRKKDPLYNQKIDFKDITPEKTLKFFEQDNPVVLFINVMIKKILEIQNITYSDLIEESKKRRTNLIVEL